MQGFNLARKYQVDRSEGFGPEYDIPESYLVSALTRNGFRETSWHNDSCPSFALGRKDGASVYVYVDAVDPEERETGGPRFYVYVHTPDGANEPEPFETENPYEALGHAMIHKFPERRGAA